jgi:hypothetical protein
MYALHVCITSVSSFTCFVTNLLLVCVCVCVCRYSEFAALPEFDIVFDINTVSKLYCTVLYCTVLYCTVLPRLCLVQCSDVMCVYGKHSISLMSLLRVYVYMCAGHDLRER